MPFVDAKITTPVSESQRDAIKSGLGRAVSVFGKGESWLMVGIRPEYTLYFKGDNSPAAMVDVSIYGAAQPSDYDKLTGEICRIINEQLAVETSRIYVKYTEVENWGWNGSNF